MGWQGRRALGIMIITAVIGLWALPARAVAADLVLVVSGALEGELEPCGCSDGAKYGGLRRRATLLARLRKDHPDLITLSSGGLFDPSDIGHELRSEFILKGLPKLSMDAIGIKWSDLAYGPEVLKQSGLPFVASNWAKDTFSRRLLIERSGHKVGVLAWLDPKTSPYQGMKGKAGLAVVDQDFSPLLEGLKSKGALSVLIGDITPEDLSKLAPKTTPDLVILSPVDEFPKEPKKIGATWYLTPGSRGQRLSVISLHLNGDGAIATLTQQVEAMDDKMPNDQVMEQWYQGYEAKVREDYRARVKLRKSLRKGETDYVGESVCRLCHGEQHAIWRQSNHAKALDVLKKVNKDFDRNCLQCHTVGFEKDGGYFDQALTANLAGVQCESCHGPAREHVKSKGAVKPMALPADKSEICKTCHNHDHSPAFDFTSYWPKIAHKK